MMRSVDRRYREGEIHIVEDNGYWVPLGSMACAKKHCFRSARSSKDRPKSEFESLQTGVSEPVAEHFARRVHVVLTKLTRYQVTTPAREIKPRVLGDLIPRFPDERFVCTQ